jgi:hypothetical protein
LLVGNVTTMRRVMSITRPTLDPAYEGHLTTSLYELSLIPDEVLGRIRSMPEEPSWEEVLTGHLKANPSRAITIQVDMERARFCVLQASGTVHPDCTVVAVRVYPGRPVVVPATSLASPVVLFKPQQPLKETVHLQLVRVVDVTGGVDHYVLEELPPPLRERILDGESESVQEVIFGDMVGNSTVERYRAMVSARLDLSRARDRLVLEVGTVVRTLR